MSGVCVERVISARTWASTMSMMGSLACMRDEEEVPTVETRR